MRCGSSNLLLNHLQQIGLHRPQLLQLTLKCILIGAHRTLKLHHKIILFFFGGIHFFRIHFQLFKKNLIRFMRYRLVELPDNQIIFLNIDFKIHNLLFKFGYFRYNFRIQILHIFILCKALQLPPKPLAIGTRQLIIHLQFKFFHFFNERSHILLQLILYFS